MTDTREPWEVAWEEEFVQLAYLANREPPLCGGDSDARARRACYRAGYNAALSQQEEVVRLAKVDVLEELELLTHQLASCNGNAFASLFRKEAMDTLLTKYAAKPEET